MREPANATKILAAIGRRVAELRGAREWTQATFAERLEVTTRYVQSIEGGEVNMTVEYLVRLANALEVPLAALFEAPTPGPRRRGRPRKVEPAASGPAKPAPAPARKRTR